MRRKCMDCPRRCEVDRTHERGYCKAQNDPVVSSVMVHRGEESVISGSRGSGTIFFSGCNLGCVFCQNHDISQSCTGTVVTVSRLARTFMELTEQGVHNINLVAPSHFVPQVAEAIGLAKDMGIDIPVVYNSNGYDSVDSLKLLDGLVDIYMPDLKYADNALGQLYSDVTDYFTVAQEALKEMYRQVGGAVVQNDILKSGVLVRHLMMPGLAEDSKKVLGWIKANIPDAIVNLMDQYRPAYRASKFREINRRLTGSEYRSMVSYFNELGLKGGKRQIEPPLYRRGSI